ncbi:hypothetical protein CEXT_725941 [Caerostris extrusa]|uniref:LAGLIDADG homing endonuclease n=1 Tax=Caerostris extrusa TaxID=172846 RepID=A0AAV4M5N9_CAEEX|nr:hypothetical protein CEXT_725941 [Caerostris extrusa]
MPSPSTPVLPPASKRKGWDGGWNDLKEYCVRGFPKKRSVSLLVKLINFSTRNSEQKISAGSKKTLFVLLKERYSFHEVVLRGWKTPLC